MAKRSVRGFTLVELLVVITIISILASSGFVVFSGVQKQARISKRGEDLRAIKTALEVYYQANKVYPSTANGGAPIWTSQCAGSVGNGTTSDQVVPSQVIQGQTINFVPSYMQIFPSDPSMNIVSNTSCYRYKSDGVNYKLQDFSVPSTEMSTADFKSQSSLIDPATDGPGGCSTVEPAGTPTAWAVYSNNTGANDATTNPACWN